jgi:hypothetical protein
MSENSALRPGRGAGQDRDHFRAVCDSVVTIAAWRPNRMMWIRSATSNVCGAGWGQSAALESHDRVRAGSGRGRCLTLRDAQRSGRVVHDDQALGECPRACPGDSTPLAAMTWRS